MLAGDIKLHWRLNEESCVKIAEAEKIGVERLYSLKIHAIPNVKVKIYIFLLLRPATPSSSVCCVKLCTCVNGVAAGIRAQVSTGYCDRSCKSLNVCKYSVV